MRTIGDVAVEDVDGIIHFVDTDFASKTVCYGIVELKFVRCLNIEDETDEDFNFESEEGKKLCTDIVLFILSLISQRPTRIHILELFLQLQKPSQHMTKAIYKSDFDLIWHCLK